MNGVKILSFFTNNDSFYLFPFGVFLSVWKRSETRG